MTVMASRVSAPPIATTVQQLYGMDARLGPTLGIAAIIFLFVEPEYRGRDVGKLALQVIALIQGCANADFTILVADDKSGAERTLVKWFEAQGGYKQAPLLQDMMGSPHEQFGVSMIAPTNATGVPHGCKIQWW
jgi:GNAT superfamily N-acetyltransferase